NLRIEGRTARPPSPPVGPLPPDQLAVPPQERLGLDEEHTPPVSANGAARCRKHDPVESAQSERSPLPAKHPNLVPEHGVLELQGADGRPATHPGKDPLEEEVENQKHRRMLEGPGQQAD